MLHSAVLLGSFLAVSEAACPFSNGGGILPAGHPYLQTRQSPPKSDVYYDDDHELTEDEYVKLAKMVDWTDIRQQLRKVMKTPQDWWPADWGKEVPPPEGNLDPHYGPLFIRMAWHCAGSYRKSDGRGGCRGGRQRFDPERSWEDNTNLDKARTLLGPIKRKCGGGCSWGDLIVLAGTEAISFMGGNYSGFCAGRYDDRDGSKSLELGPSDIQRLVYPCEKQDECKEPLGSVRVGLIYVDPVGRNGQPVPIESAEDIRDVFGRMGMNDEETVALIAGGHEFGKLHGACPDGPGPSPAEDPTNPWPGKCGTGKGKDTFTSGLEGPWTQHPTMWKHEYFVNLLNKSWELERAPGGAMQWKVLVEPTRDQANYTSRIKMLTSDLALKKDLTYLNISLTFRDNHEAFNVAFKEAWYKLMTRDSGSSGLYCLNDDAPPPKEWQHPLPEVEPVEDKTPATKVMGLVDAATRADPKLKDEFVRLAMLCTLTRRTTDNRGGCNGARIFHAPGNNWTINQDIVKSAAKAKLEAIQDDTSGWSLSDLIILSGSRVVQNAGIRGLFFCGGRVDDPRGDGWEGLQPRITGQTTNLLVIEDYWKIKGLSREQMVALSQVSPTRVGNLDNITIDYYEHLLTRGWEEVDREEVNVTSPFVKKVYKNGKFPRDVMVPTDMALRWSAESTSVMEKFLEKQALFQKSFTEAWHKMVNADLPPGGNATDCLDLEEEDEHEKKDSDNLV